MAIDLQKAADTLVRDHAHQSNLVPFARAWGATDLAGAYAIQDAFVQRMLATHGKRVGYKIGLTSKRMQQMCSIDHPVAGVVLERRLLRSGAQLELSSLVRLGIEFEICVRLGRSLPPRAQPVRNGRSRGGGRCGCARLRSHRRPQLALPAGHALAGGRQRLERGHRARASGARAGPTWRPRAASSNWTGK